MRPVLLGKMGRVHIGQERAEHRTWEEGEMAVTYDKDKLEISANSRSGGLMERAWAYGSSHSLCNCENPTREPYSKNSI